MKSLYSLWYSRGSFLVPSAILSFLQVLQIIGLLCNFQGARKGNSNFHIHISSTNGKTSPDHFQAHSMPTLHSNYSPANPGTPRNGFCFLAFLFFGQTLPIYLMRGVCEIGRQKPWPIFRFSKRNQTVPLD